MLHVFNRRSAALGRFGHGNRHNLNDPKPLGHLGHGNRHDPNDPSLRHGLAAKTVRLFITGFWLGSPPQGRRAGQTGPVGPQENFFIVVK